MGGLTSGRRRDRHDCWAANGDMILAWAVYKIEARPQSTIARRVSLVLLVLLGATF